jgi:hypothetical protein
LQLALGILIKYAGARDTCSEGRRLIADANIDSGGRRPTNGRYLIADNAWRHYAQSFEASSAGQDLRHQAIGNGSSMIPAFARRLSSDFAVCLPRAYVGIQLFQVKVLIKEFDHGETHISIAAISALLPQCGHILA